MTDNHKASANETTINVSLTGGESVKLPQGIKIMDLLKTVTIADDFQPVAARLNNTVVDLYTTLDSDCELEFIGLHSADGMRVYQRSLIFLLVKATGEVLPGCTLTVKHSLGNGLYCDMEYTRFIRDIDIAEIEKRMMDIVKSDEPIMRKQMPREAAVALFAGTGHDDLSGLLKYGKSELVDIHTCGGFIDYSYGPMVPTTGVLKTFRLRYYLPGLIMELPRLDEPDVLPEYKEHGKLANIFYESSNWHKILNVRHAASLNDMIMTAKPDELIRFIRVAEAFHEKKIIQIADEIAKNIDLIRVVLIAGPSSSGKTTFVQRLAVQLRVNGIRPFPISLDDYFVDREETPRDEDGEYDFESINAVDYALFNQHLIKLIQGEEVEIPFYNFLKGRREWLGNKLRLGHSDLTIIEGIHGLNDVLTSSIPKGRKFKIYVSALTQLNLDKHNRIPTTDLRLLRRIVRDYMYRGYSAQDTIRRWPSVRRGEERNIFPFQESADVMFNSSIAYELAVLKNFAEPLLKEIGKEQPEHSEAHRLLDFLDYFLTIGIDDVPYNSIIREFIGKSCFLY